MTGLMDQYEEEITKVTLDPKSTNMAYLPVLEEKKGLVDPSALAPGPDWWGRPGKSKHSPKSFPREWHAEKAKDRLVRWNKIRVLISHAMTDLPPPQNKEAWMRFVSKISTRPPEGLMGPLSGIVIAGGGPVYFSSAWVVVRQLRALGCNLPVEMWVTQGEEVPVGLQATMRKEGISVMDASDLLDSSRDGQSQADKVASGMDKRFPLKAIAIAYSRFRHVLSLDADNFPAHNPERLLRSGGYVRTGAMFWPDFWPLEASNGIWSHLDKSPVVGMQQESGQLLIDKQQHWKPLLLALYMNLESSFYYTMLQGDKDTFQFSWRALDAPFTMIPIATGTAGKKQTVKHSLLSHSPHTITYSRSHLLQDIDGNTDRYFGHTMIQYDVYQRPLFFHRNLRKWTTGLRPKNFKVGQLQDSEREWLMLKACRPAQGHARDTTACRDLVDWVHAPDTSGFITFRPFAEHASTISSSVTDAVGYDLEAGILTAFDGLWAMPQYEDYVTTNFGPAGEYLMSCRKCKLDKKTVLMSCQCRDLPVPPRDGVPGRDSEWVKAIMPRPHDCTKVGFDIINSDGKLTCTGTQQEVKHRLNQQIHDKTSLLKTSVYPTMPKTKSSAVVDSGDAVGDDLASDLVKAHPSIANALSGIPGQHPIQDLKKVVPLAVEATAGKYQVEEDLQALMQKVKKVKSRPTKEAVFNLPKRVYPKHSAAKIEEKAASVTAEEEAAEIGEAETGISKVVSASVEEDVDPLPTIGENNDDEDPLQR